uniref:two pore calcium channel protein 1-like n=1 Tax=Styela clava TaxID=7725 RepID=UPI0019393E66|nr:two pore calcium channel protein 1-like [Styela clava]
MIPAYNEVKPLALVYFITIILTGQLILYGILVARIFDFYVKANKKFVKKERFQERQCLIKAFEALDVNKNGFVSYKQWESLFKCLRPKAGELEALKRFNKLKEISKEDSYSKNIHASDKLSLFQFFHLLEVLQLTVEIKKDESNENSRKVCSALFRIAKQWKSSSIGYYVSIFLNVFFLLPFALVWWGMTPTTAKLLYTMEFITLILILVDVVLRLIAAELKNEMILHVIMAMIATAFMLYILFTGKASKAAKGWAALATHAAVILRLISIRGGTSTLSHWLRRITPPLCTLLCLITVGFYSYGIIGMEWFGYLEKEHGHRELPKALSLCRYGFESLGCSLLTLFQISLGSSWHRVMDYIMVEVSPWASTYFVLFYAMMQMVVLNVISAVMVEVSNAIYSDEIAVGNEEKPKKEVVGSSSIRSTELSRPIQKLTSSKGREKNSLSSAFAMTSTVAGFTSFTTLTRIEEESGDETSEIRSPLEESLHALKLELQDITEEDSFEVNNIETHSSIRLTGRKTIGNWTRDMAQDITFLNADELKRLQDEMGATTKGLKISKIDSKSSISNKSNAWV